MTNLSEGNLVSLSAVSATVAVAALVAYVIQDRQQRKREGSSSASRQRDVISPPHLRTFVPFLGCALEMNAGPVREFLRKYRYRFGDVPVFTAFLAGKQCAFICDQQYWNVPYRDAPEIDKHSVARTFFQNVLGFNIASEEELDFHLTGPTKQLLLEHLMSREALEQTIREAQVLLKENLSIQEEGSTEETLHLFAWTRRTIFRASAGPLVGRSLLKDESIMDDFFTFDEGIPLIFIGALPKFLCRAPLEARDRIIAAMASTEFEASESPLMKDRRELMLSTLGREKMAKANLAILVGSISNSAPGVFWVLWHLLSDEKRKAWNACQTEIKKIVSSRDTTSQQEIDFFSLEELDQMVTIQSVFYEALRLHHTISSVRDLRKDFILNTKGSKKQYLIPAGTRLMSYSSTVHYDAAIFENPTEFKFDRFLDSNAKAGKMPLKNHLRLWGGGSHLCLGRKFIAYETQALVAMIIQTIDHMELVDAFYPNIRMDRQGIQVDHPAKDPRFKLRLRQKQPSL